MCHMFSLKLIWKKTCVFQDVGTFWQESTEAEGLKKLTFCESSCVYYMDVAETWSQFETVLHQENSDKGKWHLKPGKVTPISIKFSSDFLYSILNQIG